MILLTKIFKHQNYISGLQTQEGVCDMCVPQKRYQCILNARSLHLQYECSFLVREINGFRIRFT